MGEFLDGAMARLLVPQWYADIIRDLWKTRKRRKILIGFDGKITSDIV